MPNVFDHLHIKKHTVGSSNELSFDVLDAASQDLDSKKKRSSTPVPIAPKRMPGADVGARKPDVEPASNKEPADTRSSKAERATGPSEGQASPIFGHDEVMRRKKARRARSIRTRVIVAALCAVVLVAGGVFAYNVYSANVDFTNKFDSLVSRVEHVDETLVEMDAVMEKPLSTESAAQREALQKKLPDAAKELEEVRSSARSLGVAFTGGKQDVAISELEVTTSARLDMIDAASEAFELAARADTVVDTANEAWESVLKADQTARDATSAANKASTDEEIAAAEERTQSAISELRGAKETLVRLEGGSAGSWFEQEEAYLDKRIAALEFTAATTEALLAGDKDTAEKANDSYNAADAAAATLGAALPASIGDKAWSMFEKDLQACVSAYADARSQAADSDADLRAFLDR